MNQSFNNKMLTLARESRGLTQKELSDITTIPQSSISRLENGNLGIDEDTLNKLCLHLRYPQSFFYQRAEVYPSNLHYRKRASVPVKTLSQAEALMNIYRSNIVSLLKSVELPDMNVPRIENYESANEVAMYVRQYWNLPKGPIPNLTKLLEDKGIIIIQCDLFTDKIVGRSMISENGHFIIFLNKDLTGDRQRFTLAHELGHLVMHINSPNIFEVDIEEEANTFASEFLMPQNEILPQLSGKIDLSKLADLKRYWKTSMQAILVWAQKLDAVTANQAKYLWVQFASLKIRIKEPIEIAPEMPSLLSEIVNAHLKDLGYSKEDLAGILNLLLDDFEGKYLNESKRVVLKIVR